MLSAPDAPPLAACAAAYGLAPATLSRGFKRAYGTTPRRFAFEARTRHALRLLAEHATPLAAVALDAGFADQAHFSHAVRALTGLTPRQWRAAATVKSRQDAAEPCD